MTDLASSGRADGLCLAGGVAGHIVVVHISLRLFLVDAVKHLLIAEGAEGSNRENLSLTSREESRAVRSGKEIDLCGKRTDLVHSSAVNALLVVDEPAADDLLLDLVDKLFHSRIDIGIFPAEPFNDGILYRDHSLIADSLVGSVESEHDVLLAEIKDLVEHFVVEFTRLITELRLSDL